MERADQNVAPTKQTLEGELNQVKEYLAWVRQDAAMFSVFYDKFEAAGLWGKNLWITWRTFTRIGPATW